MCIRDRQRLAPLAQRLHVDFGTDRRFDNPRAVQIRLSPFDHGALLSVGRRVRDLYAQGRANESRLRAVADDAYIDTLARAVAGGLGGKVGIAPRLFLKKLVADVLDRIDLHQDFDPRQHYQLTLDDSELDGDVSAEWHGVKVVTDRMSAPYLAGATIDFVDTISQQGFTIDNPNAGGSCACGDSFH